MCHRIIYSATRSAEKKAQHKSIQLRLHNHPFILIFIEVKMYIANDKFVWVLEASFCPIILKYIFFIIFLFILLTLSAYRARVT